MPSLTGRERGVPRLFTVPQSVDVWTAAGRALVCDGPAAAVGVLLLLLLLAVPLGLAASEPSKVDDTAEDKEGLLSVLGGVAILSFPVLPGTPLLLTPRALPP